MRVEHRERRRTPERGHRAAQPLARVAHDDLGSAVSVDITHLDRGRLIPIAGGVACRGGGESAPELREHVQRTRRIEKVRCRIAPERDEDFGPRGVPEHVADGTVVRVLRARESIDGAGPERIPAPAEDRDLAGREPRVADDDVVTGTVLPHVADAHTARRRARTSCAHGARLANGRAALGEHAKRPVSASSRIVHRRDDEFGLTISVQIARSDIGSVVTQPEAAARGDRLKLAPTERVDVQ